MKKLRCCLCETEMTSKDEIIEERLTGAYGGSPDWNYCFDCWISMEQVCQWGLDLELLFKPVLRAWRRRKWLSPGLETVTSWRLTRNAVTGEPLSQDVNTFQIVGPQGDLRSRSNVPDLTEYGGRCLRSLERLVRSCREEKESIQMSRKPLF